MPGPLSRASENSPAAVLDGADCCPSAAQVASEESPPAEAPPAVARRVRIDGADLRREGVLLGTPARAPWDVEASRRKRGPNSHGIVYCRERKGQLAQ